MMSTSAFIKTRATIASGGAAEGRRNKYNTTDLYPPNRRDWLMDYHEVAMRLRNLQNKEVGTGASPEEIERAEKELGVR